MSVALGIDLGTTNSMAAARTSARRSSSSRGRPCSTRSARGRTSLPDLPDGATGRLPFLITRQKFEDLLDVNPASLSIQSVGGYAERLLDKNAPIPIEKTRVFTTARDHQTRVEIDCCRGEGRRYSDNEPLGTLVLEDLPPRQRGDVQIEVSFRVDADGILHVSATDQTSGMRREARLQVLGAPVEES
jgi:molecular chaperone DnaK (HSP70)